MSDQLVHKNNAMMEQRGRKIYRSNQHFRRLANVMEHPEFREFFDEYMQDWDTAKTIIMFMKIYEGIEKHSKIELTPFQKISIVKDVIDDGEMRQKVCAGINKWTSNRSISSLDNKNRSCIESSIPSTDLLEDSL